MRRSIGKKVNDRNAADDHCQTDNRRRIQPLTKDGEADVSLSPHASIQANSAIGRYYLARASSGVAVVPGFVARHDLAEGRVVRLCEDWQIEPLEVFAEWHSNTPRQSITQLFVNQISESLAFHNKAGGL